MKITYTGGLADGFVQCQRTLRQFSFQRNVAFEVSSDLGEALLKQNPSEWVSGNAAPVAPQESEG